MLQGVRKRYVTKYDGGTKPLGGKYVTGGTKRLCGHHVTKGAKKLRGKICYQGYENVT